MRKTSDYLTHGQRLTRRREAARRRRSRRRRIAALALALTLAAALAAVGLSRPHSHGSAAASTRPGAHQTARHAHAGAGGGDPRPTRSAIGLPLGTPALALKGLGDPTADAVHPDFRTPPRAGLLFNLDTGQVLWQSDPYARLRIASLTKMMTALLTVRAAPADAPVLVTKQAVEAAGSKVGVLPLGRHVRLVTLLYGLLLPSGNDAADALATHVAGSLPAFVKLMNEEAARLGMGCTHYTSPSGYIDQYNFSCAADLALLAHVDLQQPRIASIARTYTAKLPLPIKGGHVWLYNNNPLLVYHYPGATGLKTGYTLAAGRCLVATAQRDGVRLGVVLLHSPDPGVQASYLLDRGFQGVYRQPPVPAPAMPPGA